MLPLSCIMAGAKEECPRQSRQQFSQIQAENIAKELNLDATTGKRFTETYMKCQQEIWKIEPGRPPRHREANTADLTEQEAQKIITDRFIHRQKMNEIQERYYKEYSKFLTQKQILRMYDHEWKMMEKMMHKHKRHKQK